MRGRFGSRHHRWEPVAGVQGEGDGQLNKNGGEWRHMGRARWEVHQEVESVGILLFVGLLSRTAEIYCLTDSGLEVQDQVVSAGFLQ